MTCHQQQPHEGHLDSQIEFSIFKKDQVIFFFLWNRGFCISAAWFLGAPDKGFQKECPAVQNKGSVQIIKMEI